MLEHIVVAQILDHLDRNNILHENHYGFPAHRSCESQLLLTTDDINRSINQGRQVDMGILDFAKAFDKVSHRRLALKMSYYGIRIGTLNWITEFLWGHQQQVVVDQGWQSTGQFAYWPDQWSILVLTGHYWSIGGQLVDWKNHGRCEDT